MSKLVEQMLMDMTLQNLSPKTIKAYSWHIRKFCGYYSKSPEELNEEDIRHYLYNLKTIEKCSSSNISQAYSAIKFMYRTILKMPMTLSKLKGPKREKKLPVVLSRSEVKRLLHSVENDKHQLILKTIYSGGMRVSEATHLCISDIDSSRMVIRINQGKGNQDRYTLLSKTLLEDLRRYWLTYKPRTWLFPAKRKVDSPIHESAVQKAFSLALKKSKIIKPATVHTLRHSFATHLLEQGVSILTIQHLLGHAHLHTTMIYLHIQKYQGMKIINPLDNLEVEL